MVTFRYHGTVITVVKTNRNLFSASFYDGQYGVVECRSNTLRDAILGVVNLFQFARANREEKI